MDSIIARETIRERGANAYDKGLGVDDHNMNPSSPAIKDWQFGWHTRRIEVAQTARKAQAHLQLAGVTPP